MWLLLHLTQSSGEAKASRGICPSQQQAVGVFLPFFLILLSPLSPFISAVYKLIRYLAGKWLEIKITSFPRGYQLDICHHQFVQKESSAAKGWTRAEPGSRQPADVSPPDRNRNLLMSSAVAPGVGTAFLFVFSSKVSGRWKMCSIEGIW